VLLRGPYRRLIKWTKKVVYGSYQELGRVLEMAVQSNLEVMARKKICGEKNTSLVV
jgi:hypothetical protein